jgi:hypothetical protein
MKSRTYYQAILALSVLTLMPGHSQALELKSGKWGFNSTVVAPMSPQPIEEYTEQCIADEDFDPLAEMMAAMEQQCEVTVKEDTATRLGVALQCTIPGAGAMTGDLEFSVDSSNANGQMQMNMNMGGQTVVISNTWKGEYLGACD